MLFETVKLPPIAALPVIVRFPLLSSSMRCVYASDPTEPVNVENDNPPPFSADMLPPPELLNTHSVPPPVGLFTTSQTADPAGVPVVPTKS